MNDIAYLIVDWGTSNFRAFALNQHHQLLRKTEHPKGLLSVKKGAFAEQLADILEPWLGDYQGYPIYMAGMVGAANGWMDTGYVATPANVHNLAAQCVHFTLPWGAPGYIIPGVKHQQGAAPDVMRGEEIQLLGLMAVAPNIEYAILPGTHSKHAQITPAEQQIRAFTTYMTGEMFALLSQHSLLGRALPKAKWDAQAFEQGLMQSDQTGSLLSHLFTARSKRVLQQCPESSLSDYLSGLLLGEELKHRLSTHQPLALVGGQKLCLRYQLACETLGITSQIFDGDDCFLRGMIHIKEQIQ